ncbi:Alpha/Beta hydrolase protein [Phascolomyces articulosus]|uniref:Alpha/Beta hydrolase protein n=1 Tax=Phascolomyces articulosus TaxID=60185 RepID=A0AAD5JVA1_9FUNG|nr:Alpha/Beta hydrolase protein [Phascolomyces articulosus]
MLFVQTNDILQNNTTEFPVTTEVPVHPDKKAPTLLRRSPSRGGGSSSLASYNQSDQQQYHSETNQPPLPRPKQLNRTYIQWACIKIEQFISSLLSLSILTVICTIAFAQNAYRALTERGRIVNSDEHNDPEEKIVADECYYIKRWGYEPRIYDIVTDDGYILRMYRIMNKRPVLLGHGLFQCSGDFILNEEKSLAFVLADQGYDVWLGNTRAAGSFDHVSLSYRDPEYWAWGLKELGIYDWPTMIDFIREETGCHKIAYIGHSQGTSMAFVGLKLRPEIAEKLSCFVALAPAVFSGTLTKPVSSQLISDWMEGWGKRGVLLYVTDAVSSPITSISTMGLSSSTPGYVPLTVFYGTDDYLVDGERFVQTFDGYENYGRRVSPQDIPYLKATATKGGGGSGKSSLFPMLKLVHAQCIDGYEHMDTIFGYDNIITTYPAVFNALSTAQWNSANSTATSNTTVASS